MKRICILIIAFIMLCMPLTAFAAETPESSPTETPEIAVTSEPTTTSSPTVPPTSATTPDDTPAPIVAPGQLSIDSNNLYPGMSKTYAQGYVPAVDKDNVTIILPLIGKTYDGEVILSADLGATTDTPFVFGNYAQTAYGEPYVFAFSIPLVSGRINGVYPVTMNASYIDMNGALITQAFVVYVTITDGKEPIDPNAIQAPIKETIDKPELFISSCAVSPNSVGADETFTVTVTIDNIGSLKAKSIRLSYSGAEGVIGITPVNNESAIHLENIAAGKSDTASFKLKTTTDVLSGTQAFAVTLDYVDAYGGVYTSTRNFLVAVSQPADFTYDDIIAAVPESITAGESFVLPANVYNTGKSTLKKVMIEVTGDGLFPKAAAFLGDIAPGETGNGEISIFAGQLNGGYGMTNAFYTITYTDEAGIEQKEEVPFSIEIKEMVIEPKETEPTATEQPAFQWWVTILVGFAIITVIVAVIVVTKVLRNSKMR